MERLTSREPRISGMPGVCCTHFEGGDCQAIQGLCADGCAWEEAAWERLAAYEDTGLEPEEVTQIKLAIMGKSLAEIKEFEGVSTDRMIELTQAEKDGRLVVLPDAKYTDADGEKALQKAMWTCGNTNYRRCYCRKAVPGGEGQEPAADFGGTAGYGRGAGVGGSTE